MYGTERFLQGVPRILCSTMRAFTGRQAPPSGDPRHNKLLAALPDEDWQRWLPHVEWMDMPLGHVLYESGVPMSALERTYRS